MVVPRLPGMFGSGGRGMRARFQSMVTSPATTTVLGSATLVSSMAPLLLLHPNDPEARGREDVRDGPNGVAVELPDVLGKLLPGPEVRTFLSLHVLLGRVSPAVGFPLPPPPVV